MAKALKVVSSNGTFEFPKSKMIMDNVMLTFKFQQKCLNTNFMFLHSWLHQSEYLGSVQSLSGLELSWRRMNVPNIARTHCGQVLALRL